MVSYQNVMLAAADMLPRQQGSRPALHVASAMQTWTKILQLRAHFALAARTRLRHLWFVLSVPLARLT